MITAQWISTEFGTLLSWIYRSLKPFAGLNCKRSNDPAPLPTEQKSPEAVMNSSQGFLIVCVRYRQRKIEEKIDVIVLTMLRITVVMMPPPEPPPVRGMVSVFVLV